LLSLFHELFCIFACRCYPNLFLAEHVTGGGGVWRRLSI
jgi:hypothetical protein